MLVVRVAGPDAPDPLAVMRAKGRDTHAVMSGPLTAPYLLRSEAARGPEKSSRFPAAARSDTVISAIRIVCMHAILAVCRSPSIRHERSDIHLPHFPSRLIP